MIHFVGSLASFISLYRVGSFWGSGRFLIFRSISVKLHEFCKIELRFLEDLDLSDNATVFLEWEDFGAAL